MNKLYSTSMRHAAVILTVLLSAVSSMTLSAFDQSVYATQSLMSSGRWVRISVPSTGLYRISTDDLRRCGFNNPASVRVMGYGGQCISDVLKPDNYTDDLVAAPQEATASGIVFYGLGPETWTRSSVAATSGFYSHSLNPYSSAGYYFLTDAEADVSMPVEGDPRVNSMASERFTSMAFHESDLTSPGESGHMLVGEDFRYTRSRTFTLDTPDRADSEMTVMIKFVTNSPAQCALAITINGKQLPDKYSTSATTSSVYGTLNTFYIKYTDDDTSKLPDKTTVKIDFTPAGNVTLAALDAIDINYERKLQLASGSLCFSTQATYTAIDGCNATTRVWDVTDVTAPRSIAVATDGTKAHFTNVFGSYRSYAAWNDNATLPSPEIIGETANQNLHGAPTPDMVVVVPAQWRSQADRLARLHQADSLRVLVVTDQEVFNEFSSGTPDVGGVRRLLKMMYDRGTSDDGHSLRYALMMGRVTHDPRQLTTAVKSLRETTLVGWSTAEGLRESDSYCSDDILGLLEDGAGQRMPADRMCIGVGRVPAGNVAEATAYVDKLESYMTKSKPGPWKNRVMIVADDGDNAVHAEQAEKFESYMRRSADGNSMVYDKVYVDAYDEVGGTSEIGRSLMHRNLEDGTVFWSYIGHANKQVLGSERLLTYNDMSSVKWSQLPFLYAATCSFNRWDGLDKSGAEILLHNSRGGIIGGICPVREVYISENEYITNAVGRSAFMRNSDGRRLAVGDLFRMAKNDVRNSTGNLSYSSNKMRYVLIGDPALRLATPDLRIRVDSLNGIDVNDTRYDIQPSVMARQMVTINGTLLSADSTMTAGDFNGTLTAVLYDAERSITTQGRDSDNTTGKPITFEQQGDMLFTGCCTVTNGRFELNFAMPEDISDNFRPAALNLYAVADDGREAITCFRNIYVFGYDDSVEADTIAPSIDYAYMNHSSFADGDIINASPMFIASVSDNVGINLSTSGVGHLMTIRIDDSDSYSDVSSYYSPMADGSVGGTVAYQLNGLLPGPHKLAFRVWDTSGNSSTHTMTFNVSDRLAPKLFDVYTDANPASTHANFYLSHNRPDAEITATIEVFALNGRMVWSSSVTDRSDMFTSAPITWNLCDNGGHRVVRGIYLYRATVTCDGQTSSSETRRLAVTGN